LYKISLYCNRISKDLQGAFGNLFGFLGSFPFCFFKNGKNFTQNKKSFSCSLDLLPVRDYNKEEEEDSGIFFIERRS
jgi:hypothetical protein